MPSQTLGVLLVTLGFWVAYCGVYGIPVWDTLVAVIKNPGGADKTLDLAKKRAGLALADDTAGYVAENWDGGSNPFVGRKINRDFKTHVADGSGAPGIDFDMPVGTPLPAIWGGVVTNIANNGNAGNTIAVKRDNGDTYRYLHASKFNILNGTRVKPGAILGLSGGAKGAPGAGNSTGPHLHLDYMRAGKFIDPMPVITGGPDARNREGGGSF